MAEIISVATRKGGVGKTTTAVNLASALQARGKKTLLIDLDPQENATISVGINPETLTRSIKDLFSDIYAKPQEIIVLTEFGLSVLPSKIELKKIEAGMTAASVGALKSILTELESGFDFIIIDTMPSQSYLSLNALVASHSILIPLETHYLALQGLKQEMNEFEELKRGINPNLDIIGILPTKVQPTTKGSSANNFQKTGKYDRVKE